MEKWKLREVERNLPQITPTQKWWQRNQNQVLALHLPLHSVLPIHKVVTSPGKASKPWRALHMGVLNALNLLRPLSIW